MNIYTKREVGDIAISTLVLGFALMNILFPKPTPSALFLATSLVAVSFVFHELAHRNLARYFGCFAVYRIWPFGLIIAIVSSFFGFILAAPGAVEILGRRVRRWPFEATHVLTRETGVISIAGPITNIVVALVFLILNSWMPWDIFVLGAVINFWIAFFNLLPFKPLDGSKVMVWDRIAWVLVILIPIIGIWAL
jgi:Zn-dependent protease